MNDFMRKCYECLSKISNFIPSIVYRFNDNRTDCLIRCPIINRQILLSEDNIDEKLVNIAALISDWQVDYYQALNEERDDNARTNGKR